MSGKLAAAQGPRGVLKAAARHWYGMPVVVLALGLVSLAMLAGTNWITERLIVQDIALVSAIAEVETDLAISHLWLEEYVSGDQVPEAEIDERLRTSLALARGLLDGELPGGRRVIRPLQDPQLRQRAKRLNAYIELFDGISRERQGGFEQGEPVGIGSTLDQRYDETFGILLEEAQALEAAIEQRMEHNQARSRLLLRWIMIAWLVIVGLAVTGLWTRERRRKVAEAALSESEAQLLQAQKMEAVGRLAGGIAHDVNNYVAAITAQCELVKRKAEPGTRLHRKMEGVIDTALKVSALIKRLLAFSRRLPVQAKVINLNRVVVELEKMMERLIGEDIRLVSRLDDDLWNVKVDPSQIEQVIVNLLVNARDAMPTGGEVRIETRNVSLGGRELAGLPELEEGDYVCLGVTDTGEGIPADVIDKIFEPFFTTKGQSGSSGLGLATVYGIAKQSGGAVAVASEVGEGTEITLYLPRSREAVTEVDRDETPATPTGGEERILLVEDNEDLRQSTESVLGSLGYEVLTAADGRQALERLEAVGGVIDLLLTDVVMPGMSGRELTDRVRETSPGVKVLFVSGYADNVILRHGILEGEVAFLEKPFTSHDLAVKIREALGSKHERSADRNVVSG